MTQAAVSVPSSENCTRRTGAVYLSFRLDKNTPALISARHSQEVIEVGASQITAMPYMPEGVLGLFNRRGHIFWVVDLAQILGLSPIPVDLDTYSLIILRIPSNREEAPQSSVSLSPDYVLMGFAVRQMQGSTRLQEASIQAATDRLTANLAPYLSGLVFHQEKLCWVLDVEAIGYANL